MSGDRPSAIAARLASAAADMAQLPFVGTTTPQRPARAHLASLRLARCAPLGSVHTDSKVETLSLLWDRSTPIPKSKCFRVFGIGPDRSQGRVAFASLGSVHTFSKVESCPSLGSVLTDSKVEMFSRLWDRSTPIPKSKCFRVFGIGPHRCQSRKAFASLGSVHADSKVEMFLRLWALANRLRQMG